MTNPKVALYLRLSREDGETGQSQSIQSQRQVLEQFLQGKGWKATGTLSDAGVIIGLRPQPIRTAAFLPENYFLIIWLMLLRDVWANSTPDRRNFLRRSSTPTPADYHNIRNTHKPSSSHLRRRDAGPPYFHRRMQLGRKIPHGSVTVNKDAPTPKSGGRLWVKERWLSLR